MELLEDNMNEKIFFYELGKLVYQIDGIYDCYGRNFHISSPNLLWILYSLNDGKEHSQRQICDDWAIPRSTANTIIKELEEKGYICLHQIKGKRRELNIFLTESGKAYANNLLKDLYVKEKEVYQNIKNPEETLENLHELVLKLQVIAKEKKA